MKTILTAVERLFPHILMAIALFTAGYVNARSPGDAAIFDYRDFGPQVIAHEIIGYEWWQWDPHGSSDPAARYDIKVVLYSDGLETISKRFPVDRDNSQDYRYLDCRSAMTYLDAHIAENVLPEVTALLKRTRKRVSDYCTP